MSEKQKRTFGFFEEDVIALLPPKREFFFGMSNGYMHQAQAFNECRSIAIQNIKNHFKKLNETVDR